jgi:Zn-dependent peptidase ImmA (M78 family)
MSDNDDLAIHQIKQVFLEFVERTHALHSYDANYVSLAEGLGFKISYGNSNQAITDGEDHFIVIDPSVSKNRERFSGLHEVAHHLFEVAEDGYLRVRLIDIFFGQRKLAEDYEEYLCNMAAALLLMPTPLLQTTLDKLGYGPLTALELVRLTGASVQAAARRVAHTHNIPTFVYLVRNDRFVLDCFDHGHGKQYPVASKFSIEPEHELFRFDIPTDRHEQFDSPIPFKSGRRTWTMRVNATRDEQGRILAFFNDKKSNIGNDGLQDMFFT